MNYMNILDNFLKTEIDDSDENQEFNTPHKLRDKMLNTIPKEFWQKENKIFEPCCGKGGFLLECINYFMEGLKDKYKNKEERLKTILENCIYFADINIKNILICKFMLESDKYKLNYYQGDTLKLDILEKFNIKKFDLVLTNPPFNKSQKVRSAIWQKFVDKCIEWSGNYVLLLTPPGWRRKRIPNNQLFNKIVNENNLIYLKIFNDKDGFKYFKCSVRFDYYLISTKPHNSKKNTEIEDEENEKYFIDLTKYEWLPNKNFKKVIEVFSHFKDYEKIRGSDKGLNKDKNEEFKYPVIRHLRKNEKVIYYSKENKINNDEIKVYISRGCILNPIISNDYGLSGDIIAFIVKDKEEANKLKNFILSDDFKKAKNSSIFSGYALDFSLFY